VNVVNFVILDDVKHGGNNGILARNMFPNIKISAIRKIDPLYDQIFIVPKGVLNASSTLLSKKTISTKYLMWAKPSL